MVTGKSHIWSAYEACLTIGRAAVRSACGIQASLGPGDDCGGVIGAGIVTGAAGFVTGLELAFTPHRLDDCNWHRRIHLLMHLPVGLLQTTANKPLRALHKQPKQPQNTKEATD